MYKQKKQIVTATTHMDDKSKLVATFFFLEMVIRISMIVTPQIKVTLIKGKAY